MTEDVFDALSTIDEFNLDKKKEVPFIIYGKRTKGGAIYLDDLYCNFDKLKQSKTEFGYCKGYKPDFRPIESKLIKNVKVEPEKIYLFSDSRENLSKLTDHLSEKIMEIDSNLEYSLYHLHRHGN